MRARNLATAVLAALSIAAFAGAPPAMADDSINCELSGTAKFDTPPQKISPVTSTFGFTGSLTRCTSFAAGAPTSGTIAAGVEGLPKASFSGDCVDLATGFHDTVRGIAVVTWGNGNKTVLQFSSPLSSPVPVTADLIKGTIIASVQRDTGTKDQSGNEIYETISTDEPTTTAGSPFTILVAFQVPDPANTCTSTTGATTAGMTGWFGKGASPGTIPTAVTL